MNNSGGDPVGKKKKRRRLVCPRFACWDRLALPAGVLVLPARARLVWSVLVLAGVRCVIPGPWCLVR